MFFMWFMKMRLRFGGLLTPNGIMKIYCNLYHKSDKLLSINHAIISLQANFREVYFSPKTGKNLVNYRGFTQKITKNAKDHNLARDNGAPMKKTAAEFLSSQKKKTIASEMIERHVSGLLGTDGYWKTGGYPVFAAAIQGLVDEGLLSPVKAKGLNCKNPALFYWYRIVPRDEKPEQAKRQQLLTYYHPAINTSFYLNHAGEFTQDEPALDLLDHFFKTTPALSRVVPITANERSFQIFGDEKWLLSTEGQKFLQRVGLSLGALRCYVTHEPFFYYARRIAGADSGVKALIVENKDTFFSLKTLFQEGLSSWAGVSFALLIYGEGRKIEKSLSFFDELEDYRGIPVDFYYFGDLDPEGISIWHALTGKKPVKPFVYFYKKLFERYGGAAPHLRKGQRFSQAATLDFLAHFQSDTAAGIQKMLQAGHYLPQEGLDYAFMRELAAKPEN